MKVLLFVFAMLLSTTSLLASEREFRINKESEVRNGYAIAWGVKGSRTDFEELDKKSETDIEKFIETSHIVNYVIDLETNSIITEVQSKGVVFSIANRHYGMHFYLDMKSLNVEGLEDYDEALVLVENWKWSNSLKNLIIVNRKTEVKTVFNLGDDKFDAILKTEISKALKKKEELEFFKKGATEIGKFEELYIEKVGRVTKINLWTEIPKLGEPGLSIDVVIQVKLENNQITIKIISLTSKILQGK